MAAPDEWAELTERFEQVAREPIQTIGRLMQEMAVELEATERRAEVRRGLAPTPEDVLTAAIEQAHAHGARIMLERVSAAIFAGLAAGSRT